ncbi:MAG: hypothetical protein ABI791_11035 [Acidobacteriota bacterium]
MMIFSSKFVRRSIAAFAAVAAFIIIIGGRAEAQRRDSMTEAEIELIRDNQDIDLRVDVLTKMIDRRFAALKLDVAGWKPPAKETDKWGEEPTGTRLQLLTDVRRLLQKAVDDVDDVSEHDANALTQNKTTGKLFPKALRKLSAAASRYSLILKSSLKTSIDEMERGSILNSIDLCDQIIEASTKLPPETKKEKN